MLMDETLCTGRFLPEILHGFSLKIEGPGASKMHL